MNDTLLPSTSRRAFSIDVGESCGGDSSAPRNLTQRWMLVELARVLRREDHHLDRAHVALIADSYQRLGLQIQPIVIDEHGVLVDGAHRIAAAQRLGWTQIGAMMVHGATAIDRSLLELGANRLRKQLSPAEVYLAWETFGEPAHRARAKARQAAGGTRVLAGRGTIVAGTAPVTENFGNRDTEETTHTGVTAARTAQIETRMSQVETRVSLEQAAKETTGLSLPTLKKIREIRQLAESEDAPPALRQAAQQAFTKLNAPYAKVDPIYRALQQRAYLLRVTQHPDQTHRERAARELGDVLIQVNRVEERIHRLAASAMLHDAATSTPLGAEHLATVRISLVKTLATVIAAESFAADQPASKIRKLSAAACEMLHESLSRAVPRAQRTP